MDFTSPLTRIRRDDVLVAGGKGAGLGELLSFGMPVPRGFVVTTEAFNSFYGGWISPECERRILSSFDKLGAASVAVRSSATVEDSKSASWAGEFETYLNVRRGGLIDAIKSCWASIDSPKARAYKRERRVDENISVAVVVQEMVDAEVSGVCFTVHPVTGDRTQMVIEAGFGWGEAVVGGLITPDNYVVNKNTLKILECTVNTQRKKITSRGEEELSEREGSRQKFADKKIVELAGLCKKIEGHYGFPQDVEWALSVGRLFILQTRPITTL